jgi:membrane protein YqaA with SNARE-associated domain
MADDPPATPEPTPGGDSSSGGGGSVDQPAVRVGPIRRLYNWVLRWADHPAGPAMLFALALAESVVFPIPPDILLIALAFGAPTKAWRFALICTLGSVTGGMLGYGLGWLAAPVGKSVLVHIAGLEAYYTVADLYGRHAFVSLLLAGFTPIPSKVFTITAGIFHEWVPFPLFLGASVLSRGARFFLVAALIRKFGGAIRPFLENHLEKLTIALAAAVIAGFLLLAGGTAGESASPAKLRGLVQEMKGGNYVLRGQAAELLQAEGAPFVDPESAPSTHPAEFAALDAWLEKRLNEIAAATK